MISLGTVNHSLTPSFTHTETIIWYYRLHFSLCLPDSVLLCELAAPGLTLIWTHPASSENSESKRLFNFGHQFHIRELLYRLSSCITGDRLQRASQANQFQSGFKTLKVKHWTASNTAVQHCCEWGIRKSSSNLSSMCLMIFVGIAINALHF